MNPSILPQPQHALSPSSSLPAAPQSLLVGTGNLTRRGRATDALPYRDAVAQRLELREPPFGREAQPVITLLDKEASVLLLLRLRLLLGLYVYGVCDLEHVLPSCVG